jgi:hypothetical protein
MQDLDKFHTAREAVIGALDSSATVQEIFSAVGCHMDDVLGVAAAWAMYEVKLLRKELPPSERYGALVTLVAERGRDAWLDGCMLGLYFDAPAQGEEIGADELINAKRSISEQRLPGEKFETAALRSVGIDPEPLERESQKRAAESALVTTDRLPPEDFPEYITIMSNLWIDGLTVAIKARREKQTH